MWLAYLNIELPSVNKPGFVTMNLLTMQFI